MLNTVPKLLHFSLGSITHRCMHIWQSLASLHNLNISTSSYTWLAWLFEMKYGSLLKKIHNVREKDSFRAALCSPTPGHSAISSNPNFVLSGMMYVSPLLASIILSAIRHIFLLLLFLLCVSTVLFLSFLVTNSASSVLDFSVVATSIRRLKRTVTWSQKILCKTKVDRNIHMFLTL